MNKPEVVKEVFMQDGIGAQIWRKLYCMSYAKYYNLLFEDTPITDFLIHESDKVHNEEEKIEFINKFNTMLKNPWESIDFSNKDKSSFSESSIMPTLYFDKYNLKVILNNKLEFVSI